MEMLDVVLELLGTEAWVARVHGYIIEVVHILIVVEFCPTADQLWDSQKGTYERILQQTSASACF